MRIVVTGASGFVGLSLVPLLAEAGAELLLVGRDPARIRQAFPALAACGYGELARRGAGFDVLLHLAAANNDAGLAADAFRAANVDLALETAESARRWARSPIASSSTARRSSICATPSPSTTPCPMTSRGAGCSRRATRSAR